MWNQQARVTHKINSHAIATQVSLIRNSQSTQICSSWRSVKVKKHIFVFCVPFELDLAPARNSRDFPRFYIKSSKMLVAFIRVIMIYRVISRLAGTFPEIVSLRNVSLFISGVNN